MIALGLRFPAGRYHATPWGRHVNEAALAWPPEPVRIVRALIACHHRKADTGSFSGEALTDLIDVLAEQLPLYRLPEAVQAHTRHYMPINGKNPALVFDAFARFDPEEPLIVGWPNIVLSLEQRAHLDHLAARLGYLGRAESWAEAAVIEWGGGDANARPLEAGHDSQRGSSPAQSSDYRLVPLYAPFSQKAYREAREGLIREERERRRVDWTKKSKPTDKALDNDMKDFLASLPERLADALAIDTSDLQAVGWSNPPAMRRVLYSAPDPKTAWRGRRRLRTARERPDPTVARFVLAGRRRPRVEDTVRIAEVMRLATMAKFGWETVEGKRRPSARGVISGYGEDGKPLRDNNHAHAFWLPEDADSDGEIDHIIVYAAAGLDTEVRQKLDRVTRLWLGERGHDDEEESAAAGHTEWRLALEGFGRPDDFVSASPLLGYSSRWVSNTPYLMPWHAKKGFGWADQIERELGERGLPKLSEAPHDHGPLTIKGRDRRPIHFHRFRSRRSLTQPDTLGRFVELKFKDPIPGPLALGFGCHFGLGLFRSYAEDSGRPEAAEIDLPAEPEQTGGPASSVSQP
jgi:CRISPR-associated protein Csb2